MYLKSCVLFLLIVVACQAAPSSTTIEKSISEEETMFAKTNIELENTGAEKDRAKKSATTFLEVRQNIPERPPCRPQTTRPQQQGTSEEIVQLTSVPTPEQPLLSFPYSISRIFGRCPQQTAVLPLMKSATTFPDVRQKHPERLPCRPETTSPEELATCEVIMRPLPIDKPLVTLPYQFWLHHPSDPYMNEYMNPQQTAVQPLLKSSQAVNMIQQQQLQPQSLYKEIM